MDIDQIEIDKVYRVKYEHNAANDREHPALVIASDVREGEVDVLYMRGEQPAYAIVYPQEISEYTAEEFQKLHNAGTILRLYTERTNRLITKMFRL